MISRKNARLVSLAGVVIFVSTTAVLLARQFNLTPTRPVPEFRTFGPAAAAIQIYEYTDFSCPACRHAALALEDMLKIYGARIRLSFKHYPLTHVHPWSMDAAAYADCAGEQGKYWPFHDKLFSGELALGSDAYLKYASDLGLDTNKFKTCLDTNKYQAAVEANYSFAYNLGVQSTPTFFVNGIAVVGAQPFSVFKQIIDQELAGQTP